MTGSRLAAVAVGASFGGMEAVLRLLVSLGPAFGPPVLLVQHRHRHSTGSLAEQLGRDGGMRAVEAADHQRIEPGTLHVAPANYHMLVASRDTLVLSVDEPVRYSRPSVDVLFESAAEAFGDGLAGVVLTGANEDGARGLTAIHASGGCCFVQDPSMAEVPTMPLAALSAVPEALALPVEEIGMELRRLAGAPATGGPVTSAGEGDQE